MAGYNCYNEYDFEEDYLDDSDDENMICTSRYVVSSSSDEEADHILETFKAKKLVKKAQVDDQKDDFEREMESELSTTLNQLKASFFQKSDQSASPAASSQNNPHPSASGPSVGNKSPEKESEFYDDIYFDSDESEGEELSHRASNSSKGKNKRRIPTNDELFYDPTMDDRDQEWVDKMRRSYQVKSKKRLPGSPKAAKNPQPLPESDAVLNCPACLTMLCMDCQRHEIYHTQYRAMFVFNCNVNWNEVLKFPKKSQKKKEFFKNKKKMKKSLAEGEGTTSNATQLKEQSGVDGKSLEKNEEVCSSNQSAGTESIATSRPSEIRVSGQNLETSSIPSGSSNLTDEHFHPVSCSICKTKVAVYDKDEVYHFFNIVTSY